MHKDRTKRERMTSQLCQQMAFRILNDTWKERGVEGGGKSPTFTKKQEFFVRYFETLAVVMIHQKTHIYQVLRMAVSVGLACLSVQTQLLLISCP